MGGPKTMNRKDNALGYKNPPSWSRFKKGQSGNPKGRPKKKALPENDTVQHSEVDDILRAELERMISVSDTGLTKQINMLQVVAKAQLKAAATGNVTAQRDIVRQAREIENRDAERAMFAKQETERKAREKIETFERIKLWKQKRVKEWADAEANNTTPTKIWPHPDDILLFPDKHEWHPRGPFGESDLPLFEYYRAERDYLFAFRTLEAIINPKLSESWLRMYDIIWLFYDVKLPLRWQLMPKLLEAMINLDRLSLPKLKAYVNEAEKRRDLLKLSSGLPPSGKDEYRVVNSILKPLLNRSGYRSLAEFEHVFETHGEDMPWPKKLA
jgi:hypothetical protein